MKTNNHSEIGWHMILGAIVFLMLVPIVGKTVYGAKRWIDLGVMTHLILFLRSFRLTRLWKTTGMYLKNCHLSR